MADSHDDSDYVHGQMDIHQQQSSYELFTHLTKWCSLFLAVILVFLVILTCTKLGWLTALISAIVVAAVGWFMLKTKPDSAH
ncbi:MAG: aa3-type cytochrome c oxidase subunit IV [Asticcacaulis sp.]|uniref:aa3-type cytochrome c oxidase subunit IV n=1 Tax=Asticcacaulis sp. TaxID=1872648 RepID=UPI0039E6AC9B